MMADQNMLIRNFQPGEATALRQVFMSAVHGLARGFYTDGQLNAWAPDMYDKAEWSSRIQSLQPFVAVIGEHVAGYADLQESGYIDHFFVAEAFAGQGVGAALMMHIHQEAARCQVAQLSAQVSLAAEAFFAGHGFVAVRRQSVTVNGVVLDNVLMSKQLKGSGTFAKCT